MTGVATSSLSTLALEMWQCKAPAPAFGVLYQEMVRQAGLWMCAAKPNVKAVIHIPAPVTGMGANTIFGQVDT